MTRRLTGGLIGRSGRRGGCEWVGRHFWRNLWGRGASNEVDEARPDRLHFWVCQVHA